MDKNALEVLVTPVIFVLRVLTAHTQPNALKINAGFVTLAILAYQLRNVSKTNATLLIIVSVLLIAPIILTLFA